jgi:hypothetical protein
MNEDENAKYDSELLLPVCIAGIVFSNKSNDKPCPKTNRNTQE